MRAGIESVRNRGKSRACGCTASKRCTDRVGVCSVLERLPLANAWVYGLEASVRFGFRHRTKTKAGFGNRGEPFSLLMI